MTAELGVNFLSFTQSTQNYKAMVNLTQRTMTGTLTSGNQSYPFTTQKIWLMIPPLFSINILIKYDKQLVDVYPHCLIFESS